MNKPKASHQKQLQEKQALIVIDIQKVYTDPNSELYCPDSKNTVARINQLVSSFSNKNLPIIYVRHEHDSNGSDAGHLFDFNRESEEVGFVKGTTEVNYDEKLIIVKNPIEITKTRYSCFQKTNLDRLLKSHSIQSIVICGFMTNFCCESTAREALDRDYYVDFIVDATGTPGTKKLNESEVRKVVSELLGTGFARVFKTERYLNS